MDSSHPHLNLKRLILKHIAVSMVALVAVGCSQAKIAQIQALEIPQTVTLKITNYCPTNQYQFIQAFGWNHSSTYENQNWSTDFDRDMLSDVFERQKSNMDAYNISYLTSDTNSDGYRDFVMAKLFRQAGTQSALPTCYTGTQDTDNDGLTDCEENLIGTDAKNPDTDGDGLPDGIEIRMGLNPLDPFDAGVDSDKDGYSNLQESIMYTPINETNTPWMNTLSYQYKTDTKDLKISNGGCFNLTVSNFPIMQVSNGNLIEVQFYERGTNGSAQLRFVKVLVPTNIGVNVRIVIDGVSNQTVDPRTTPLTIEPDSN